MPFEKDHAPPDRPLDRGRFILLLLLFFASGAAALVYEVLWLAELGRLFGATAHSAAATLAIFFLGLSVGGLVWGRRSARLRRPLRTYGWLELGIAAGAMLYFALVDVFHWVYRPLLSVAAEQPLLALAVRLVLALVILFPAAFFMGGTLPVMAQFIVREARDLGRRASLLYALNTLGATLGAFLAGFHLPRLLGYTGAYGVAICINVVVGLVALGWGRVRTPSESARPETNVDAPDATRTRAGDGFAAAPPLVWTVAIASGFLTLALEVLWTRMFAQVLQNSVYTFSAVLTVFLASLAAGSVLANRLCRLRVRPSIVLTALLVLSGVLAASTPIVFYALTDGLRPVGDGTGWSGYVLHVFALVASVLIVPVGVMGAVFPYSMKIAEPSMRSAGGTVGTLAAANTAAAIAGSLVAGFVLLALVGLWDAIRFLAVAYLVLGAIVLPRSLRVAHGLRIALLAGAAILGIAVTFPHLESVRLDTGRQERLVRTWQGPHGIVAVVDAQGSLRLKVNNTYVLGSSASHLNQRLQSQIPLSLHPDPRRVFHLGLGTGISASGVLAFPTERLVVCELNGDVIAASRECFGPWLEGLHDDPRVRVLEEDGRTYLATTTERFDVVIGDIFLTYRAGVGALYTREHFETIRDRLAPGGLFAQWLTMFDLSEAEFGIIARTMLGVFPQVTLWRRGFSPSFPVYALVGHDKREPLDAAGMSSSLRGLAETGILPDDVWIQNIPLAAYVANVGATRALYDPYPVSTDDRVPLEYMAPVTERDVERGQTSVLAWLDLVEYVRQLHDATPPETDPYLEAVAMPIRRQVEAGAEFEAYEANRRLGRAAIAARHHAAYQALVAPILDEMGAGVD